MEFTVNEVKINVNPNNNSDAENFRWCHVRAIEWASWPFFISQPIVPVALLFFPWWEVALVPFGASILWAFVRRALVVPALAHWGAWFVKLKWLACPVAAYLLISGGQWWLAALALLWPVLMFAMQMPVLLVMRLFRPTRIGDIEKMFVRSLGYELRAE